MHIFESEWQPLHDLELAVSCTKDAEAIAKALVSNAQL